MHGVHHHVSSVIHIHHVPWQLWCGSWARVALNPAVALCCWVGVCEWWRHTDGRSCPRGIVCTKESSWWRSCCSAWRRHGAAVAIGYARCCAHDALKRKPSSGVPWIQRGIESHETGAGGWVEELLDGIACPSLKLLPLIAHRNARPLSLFFSLAWMISSVCIPLVNMLPPLCGAQPAWAQQHRARSAASVHVHWEAGRWGGCPGHRCEWLEELWRKMNAIKIEGTADDANSQFISHVLILSCILFDPKQALCCHF